MTSTHPRAGSDDTGSPDTAATANSTSPATQPDAETKWKDRKKYLWILGLVVPILPFRAAAHADSFGGLFWWLGPIAVMVLIPILDLVFGTDRANPPESAVEGLEASHWYRWVLYLYLPLQYAGLIYGAYVITSTNMSWFDQLGFSITVGVVAGVGINAAHELGHKREKSERFMSRLALAQSAYGHFYVEHNRGHHLRVATPEDPASSRLGESFWEFLPRTVVGSLRSAWEIETKRLRGRNMRVFSHHNDLLTGWAMTLVLFGGIVTVFGLGAIPYLLIQAVVGFWLLEVVNYIEHYGLKRQKKESGRYERCQPEHSWNANHRVSNFLLYQLERHSDHHAHPTRRYQALRHFDEAPQLPSGYAGMLVLACVPPLWRRVMDQRVIDHYDGDVSLTNLHPRHADRYLVAA